MNIVAIRLLQLFLALTLYRIVNASGRCTTRTEWQSYFVQELFKPYQLRYDCFCAERAELLAYAAARGVKTDDYSGTYGIYTTKVTGKPLRHDSEQLRCMLDELFKGRNAQITRFIEIYKGSNYACSYAKYPDSETEGNATMALTCIFNKLGGPCTV